MSSRGAKNERPAYRRPRLLSREFLRQLFGRIRIMKVSYEYSATCHHRFSSLRKASIEARTFLKVGFLADSSAFTSFEAFMQASMIDWLNGRSCTPFATRRFNACGLRAS